MTPKRTQEADDRLERALADGRMRDPRPFYRDRLRWLKENDPAAFEQALDHYQNELVPGVAAGDRDPVGAWLEYGHHLAKLSGPGRIVEIDPEGRAGSVEQLRPDRMIVYLPDNEREPAGVVNLPPDLSAAQQATYELLVQRNLR